MIEEINAKGLEASTKEKNLMTVMELALEMCERGFGFAKVDLYKSSASEFIIEGNKLIPPFNAIPGLGTNAAINIVKAREEGEFLSKEDLQQAEAKFPRQFWNTSTIMVAWRACRIRTSCHYSNGVCE